MDQFENYETYLNKDLMQDALIKNIELVGEYVYRMTNDIKNSFPEISWGKVEKMRYLLIHQYHDVHLKTVWDTALYHIPEFEKELNRVERWIDAQKKTGFSR